MRIPKLLLETWKRTGKQSLSVALAWAIAFAPAVATAQEKSPEQKAASTSQLPAPVSKPLTNAEGGAAKLERPGGPQEGIKVHGHWVLEVRNPDGSLASRSEFENALVPTTGTNLLAALLTRGVSFGWFEIQIGDTSPSNGPCVQIAGGVNHSVNCRILETVSNPAGCPASTFASCNLASTTQPGPAGTVQVQLKGWTVPVDHAATITMVSTISSSCDPITAPDKACNPQGGGSIYVSPFTSATISVPVVKDQVITVTVTFSFS